MYEILVQYDATLISLKTQILGAYPSKIGMAISSRLPIFYSGDGEGADDINRLKIGYASPSNDMPGLASNIKKFIDLDELSRKRIRDNLEIAANTEFNYIKQQQSFLDFIHQCDT